MGIPHKCPRLYKDTKNTHRDISMGLPCTENNLKYETQLVVRSAFDDFDLLDTIETKSLTFAWSWILKTLSRNNKKQGQLRTEVGMGIGIGMELWIGTCTWCALVLWEPSLPPFHFLFFVFVKMSDHVKSVASRHTRNNNATGGTLVEKKDFVSFCHRMFAAPCSLFHGKWKREPEPHCSAWLLINMHFSIFFIWLPYNLAKAKTNKQWPRDPQPSGGNWSCNFAVIGTPNEDAPDAIKYFRPALHQSKLRTPELIRRWSRVAIVLIWTFIAPLTTR